MNITVFYSCTLCDLLKIAVEVPAREDEDVLDWMKQTIQFIANDHFGRSPNCRPEQLHDLMIPVTGANKIGGPSLN